MRIRLMGTHTTSSPILHKKDTQIGTIEPNLSSFSDHYFNYNLALSIVGVQRGYDLTCFTAADFRVHANQQQLKVVPTFHHKTYAHDVICHDLIPRPIRVGLSQLYLIFNFATKLASLSGRLGSHPKILITAIKPYQVLGLFFFLKTSWKPIQASIVFNTGELFDPLLMKGPVSTIFRRLCHYSLLKMMNRSGEQSVRVFSDSKRISSGLANALGISTNTIEVVPIPVLDISSAEASPKKQSGELVFGFLGAARGEKGFPDFQAAVSAFVALNAIDGFSFLIQLAAPSGCTPEESRAIKRIEELSKQSPAVRILKGALDPEAYNTALAAIDVLVLPYNSASYMYRTSGLLAEAIAAGKVTIVPDDTWMADHVKSLQCGVTYQMGDVGDLCRAIVTVNKRYEELSDKSKKESAVWREFNSPGRLLETLFKLTPQTEKTAQIV